MFFIKLFKKFFITFNISIYYCTNIITVTALMDTIIGKNIFLTKNAALTKKSVAQLTRKAVTKFELA